MLPIITPIVAAIWVAWDARARRSNWLVWGIVTFIAWFLVLPIWMAQRPLKAGQIREGGRAWNFLKYFALTWTLFVILVSISFGGSALDSIASSHTGAETAGAVFGTGLVYTFCIAFWFVIMIAAMLIGFFLRTPTEVEVGPTGKLASTPTTTDA